MRRSTKNISQRIACTFIQYLTHNFLTNRVNSRVKSVFMSEFESKVGVSRTERVVSGFSSSFFLFNEPEDRNLRCWKRGRVIKGHSTESWSWEALAFYFLFIKIRMKFKLSETRIFTLLIDILKTVSILSWLKQRYLDDSKRDRPTNDNSDKQCTGQNFAFNDSLSFSHQ